MAESVCVGVRVRPFNSREKKLKASLCIKMEGPQTLLIDDQGKATPFTFDESFWSHDGYEERKDGYLRPTKDSKYADQQYVFDKFGKRVLDNAWDGFHCCLFAYGQTGAGKSYSMIGDTAAGSANNGIVPISCEEIFRRIDKNENPEKRYEVTVSLVEIYNEAVQDLLILPEDRPKKGLEIRESKMLGIYIDGVTHRPVQNYAKIHATIEEATKNRTIGSTLMNATSSRAHTVQTIEFKQITKSSIKSSDARTIVSMINLVDLAGSEKAGQTGASGDRLKEGAAINLSLSALGNVIEKLAEKTTGKSKSILIPYRESKLTRLLQNALGGSSKTIMICALSPASSNYEETLSTLRYADRAKKIKNNAVVNENPQDRLMRELKEENERLKQMTLTGSTSLSDPLAHAALEAKKKEIAEVESALAEMQKSFELKLQEAKTIEEEKHNKVRRATLGLQKTSITPTLVNLNQDARLTGRLKYNIPDDQVTRVGAPSKGGQRKESREKESESGSSESDSESSESEEDDADDGPEILLMSESVSPNHAKFTNIGGECWLHAEGVSACTTFINGVSLAELGRQEAPKAAIDQAADTFLSSIGRRRQQAADSPEKQMSEDVDSRTGLKREGHKLEHGYRVVFGKCYFFYVAAHVGIPEVMITSGQVDFNMASKELKASRLKNYGQGFINKLMGSRSMSAAVRRLSGDQSTFPQQSESSGESDGDMVTHSCALNPRQAKRMMSQFTEEDMEDMDSDMDSDEAAEELLSQMVSKCDWSRPSPQKSLNDIAELQAAKEKELRAKDLEMSEMVSAKDEEIAKLQAIVRAKDSEIAELRAMLRTRVSISGVQGSQGARASLVRHHSPSGANAISPGSISSSPSITEGLQIDVGGLSPPTSALASAVVGNFSRSPASAVSSSPASALGGAGPGSPLAPSPSKAVAHMKDALSTLDQVEVSLKQLVRKSRKPDESKGLAARSSIMTSAPSLMFEF